MAACLCVWTTGCRPEMEKRDGPVRLDISVVDGIPVKSLYDRTETDVLNLAVALYDRGVLSKQYYLNSLENPQLTDVPLSRQYAVYALANVGPVSFPASEADIPALSVAWSSVNGSAAWPMAFSGSLNATAGAVLPVRLVRLVARFDLNVDASALSIYRFTAERVTLKSGAGDCRPFLSRSVPLSSPVEPDGSSTADVTALNAGGATSYYLLESCFGDLLPDNRDSWKKVPSQLAQGVAPPYVEIAGRLTFDDNSGTNRPVTYRFYLGKNATCNFDVVRNTVNTVTLMLQDDNVECGSWKVEAGPYSEQASLAFDRSVLEIPWMSSGRVSISASPGNLVYRVYEKEGSMSDAGLSFQRNGNYVYVTSTREGAVTGTLYVGTPDGRLERSCRITTVEPPVTVKQIVLHCREGGKVLYADYLDTYYVPVPWDFHFYADLYYSDGTQEYEVTDFDDMEWVIADDAVVYPYPNWSNVLIGMSPGETTACVRMGNVYSNCINLCVYSAQLHIRSVPARIDCGSDCILLATSGGTGVAVDSWEIVEGAQYGSLEQRLYMTFVSNGTNTTDVTVVVAGTCNGEVATCAIEIAAPEGGSGTITTHELTLSPPSASIEYNGRQPFTATYLTWRDGDLVDERDVTNYTVWSVSDSDVAKVTRGQARGCNTDPWAKTVSITGLYAGCEASASLTVGAAPVDPDPDPDPNPGPGPEPDDATLTGITLSLDQEKIWYNEAVQATVTAWYDDGTSANVTNAVSIWPDLPGCSQFGGKYRHKASGLRSDSRRTLSVTYASFGATAEFVLGKQYTTRVEALFPSSLSKASGDRDVPGFALYFNDSTVQEGLSGDVIYYTIDGGAPISGGTEIRAADLESGVHILTVYVYAENRDGARVLMSGGKSFNVNP